MTVLNEFVERRKARRFMVKYGAFAVLRPNAIKLGQISDLGKGGLSFLYMDTNDTGDESSELDIYVAGKKFYLTALPIHIVSEIKVPNKIPTNPIVIRRQGVQFRELTLEQTASLDAFIQDYTVGEV